MSLICGFAIYRTKSSHSSLVRIIIPIFSIGFAAFWLDPSNIKFYLLYLVPFASVFTIIYGVNRKNHSLLKFELLYAGIILSLLFITRIMHWPGATLTLILGIPSVVIFIVLMTKRLFRKEEFGCLLIINTYLLLATINVIARFTSY
jgi:hypothetical protein